MQDAVVVAVMEFNKLDLHNWFFLWFQPKINK